ncbi:MAG: bifunctional UDP-sugar hydrolase/5'-nucleotidase [Acetivibrio sp.]
MKVSKKLQKVLSVVLAVALLLGMSGIPAQSLQAEEIPVIAVKGPADGVAQGDIVILYDNDVHCAVDGYASIAALKKDMLEKTSNVALVSNGDFIQGATMGALSKGETIIDIMNQVGYDVTTLGNHEFDYGIEQLRMLTNKFQAKVVSCNYMDLETKKAVYPSYTMKKYGDKKVAFVGISTPESFTKSTPTFFQDENGKYIYSFSEDKTGKQLFARVQKTVNVARKAGADYVVALAHLGIDGATIPEWTSTGVIENTTGIDILLDGHSHSTFASTLVKNKDGKEVVSSSTGSKFNNIGKLVIAEDGKITTDLVSLKSYTKTDKDVKEYIAAEKAKLKEQTGKVIGKTEFKLTTMAPDGKKRAVRNAETNLGDFCADALRNVLEADVAIMNGGGIRADIPAGDITYDSLITVFPFGNMGCTVQATGQQLKDALEMGASLYPEENGGFLHVSGMKYTIDPSIPSSVKKDEKGMFKSVNGKYRVTEVMVLNSKTKKYEKLDLKKKYVLAGINYTLRNGGDGYTMFMNDKVLKDDTVGDNELLIKYLTENLKGEVSKEYSNLSGEGRLTIK